jgi:predicted MFS family arabinose efflux permease
MCDRASNHREARPEIRRMTFAPRWQPVVAATHDTDGKPQAVGFAGADARMLALAALGGALEFYDFIIFVFLATAIGKLFFPPDLPHWLATIQTFGIFAAGYLMRPLGGVVLAHFGDLFGRKRIFAFSILLMALATFGVACLPVYATIGIAAPLLLIVLRLLQGVAIGGEIPGAMTFVAEHVARRHVGLASGLISSGFGLGVLLGAGIAAAITVVFGPEKMLAYGWRIPFLIGGVFGLVAVWLRRWLNETPVFVRMHDNQLLVAELPLKVVMRSYRRGVVLSILFTWILSAGVTVTMLMTPTILDRLYGYTAQQSLPATAFGAIFLIIGLGVSGAIVDRIPAGWFFVVGGVFFGAATFAFYRYAGVSPLQLYALYAIMGLATSIVAAVPYVMVRCFPAPVRFTGVSFSYNLSYAIFGGLTPIIIAGLQPLSPMSPAYYLLFIATLSVGLGIYLLVHQESLLSNVGIEEMDGGNEAKS